MRGMLLALWAVTGCRYILGIPGSSSMAGPTGYGVHAQVVGAQGASQGALISLNGNPEMVADGADFMFQDRLADGDSYTVRNVNGDCVVMNGTGTIAGDDAAGVLIRCDGVAALASYGFSAPLTFEPAFDPGLDDQVVHGSFLVQQTSLGPRVLHAELGSKITQVSVAGMSQFGSPPYGPFPVLGGRAIALQVMDGTSTFMPRAYTASFSLEQPFAFGYGKASAPNAGEALGTTLAASADVLVVGAPGLGTGRALVFHRVDSTWTEDTTLPTLTSTNGFGSAVAVAGSYATGIDLAIGAPDPGSPGAVTLLHYDANSGWTHVATLMAASPQAGDLFGASIAITSNAVFVGAPGDACQPGGCVFEFTLAGAPASFTPQVTLAAGDRFGASLAVSPTNLVVGAPGDASSTNPQDPPGAYPSSGAAYLYDLATPGAPVKLKAPYPGADDQFGTAVAVSAGFVLVGAPLEDSATAFDQTDNSASAAGAAYIYAAGSLMQYLKAPTPHVGDNFGRAVALACSSTTPQSCVVAVGSPYENSGVGDVQTDQSARDAGAVFAYQVDAIGTALSATYLKAPNIGAGDNFGAALALTPEGLAIGAPLEDSGAGGWNQTPNEDAPDAGAVYTFR